MTGEATEIPEALGSRIRSERARRGWSLAQLADVSGVSKAMISKIERGESSPTAVVLGKLSGALEVSMSGLLSPSGPVNRGEVRRSADVPSWNDPETGYHRRQISTPAFPVDVTEVVLPAGARVPMPASSYAFIAQLIWVLDGTLTLVQDRNPCELRVGDTFELGPPQPREFVNNTAKPCRYLVVVTRRATA